MTAVPAKAGRDAYLSVVRTGGELHRGLIHPFERGDANLLTRLRVTMTLVATTGVALGFAMLCGPEAQPDVTDDFMGGPRFTHRNGVCSLDWLRVTPQGDHVATTLVEVIECNVAYTVDARIGRGSVRFQKAHNGRLGNVDISVNGVYTCSMYFNYRPLSSIHLYNYSAGIVTFGEVEVWCETAPANKCWASRNNPDYEAGDSESNGEVES